MEQKISYSAVILNARSRDLLRMAFAARVPEGWEWIAHHMTICLGPLPEDKRNLLDQEVELNVTHIGVSDKVLMVVTEGVDSIVSTRPHITLAVNRATNGKPKDSNQVTDFEAFEPFVVKGTVQEVRGENFLTPSQGSGITDVNTLPFIGDVEAAGGEIFQVGGAVRDKVLGKVSKDLDIVVRGIHPDDLQQILRKYGHTDLVGQSYGVIKFKAFGSTEEIDIAIPRTEKKVGPGYKGFIVNADHTLPLEKDLERRDFTMNSIAQDLKGKIIDPHNGQQDIANKVIKQTNTAAFSEDPLRMLRAVQFASRFGFSIDPETYTTIQKNAATIAEEPMERVLMEFDKIVKKGSPYVGAKLLVDSGLFQGIFKKQFKGDFRLFSQVKRMSEFVYLLLKGCIDSPDHFFKTAMGGDSDSYKEMSAFKLVDANYVDDKVSQMHLLNRVNKISSSALNSFLIQDRGTLSQTLEDMRSQHIPLSLKDMALNGDDLVEMGLEGKVIGERLKAAMDAIYAGKLHNNKEELLQFVLGPMNEVIQRIKARF